MTKRAAMNNPLTRKLELFGELPEDDRRLLDAVVAAPRAVSADQDVIREGDRPDNVHLVMTGLACRYKLVEDGQRQIIAFLLPGDFCDLYVFILEAMDHNISVLTPSTIVDIPQPKILELTNRPAIARALWWATLVDEATLREALVNMGRRSAEQRIAHLFCELHLRLRGIGLVESDTFDLPLTQSELADVVGLSAVHVNRTLQSLREKKLIRTSSHSTTILDLERLRELSGFNPNYLHLQA